MNFNSAELRNLTSTFDLSPHWEYFATKTTFWGLYSVPKLSVENRWFLIKIGHWVSQNLPQICTALPKYIFVVYLSRCSTDLRSIFWSLSNIWPIYYSDSLYKMGKLQPLPGLSRTFSINCLSPIINKFVFTKQLLVLLFIYTGK